MRLSTETYTHPLTRLQAENERLRAENKRLKEQLAKARSAKTD